MNKIEQIELFISDWKAAEEQDKALGRHKQARYAKGRQDGLAAALAIFKRPSNTAIQIDKTIDKIQDASPTRRNRMEITEEYFVEKTGWPPVDDDLERCNCDKGGQEGHSCCGWCDIHDLPIFQCGCVRLGMDGD